ncbi:MAG: hypothetical protein AB7F96_06815 [Beijerinckiaceae bacterium]
MFGRSLLVAACSLAFASTAAMAQKRENIRGTVKQVSGDSVMVAKKGGGEATVHLDAKTRISTTAKFSLADIKPGMKLGVTTVVRGNDIVAIDVRPIPPAARDGLSPYDLAPKSTMTNGVLEGTVEQSPKGNFVTIDYKTGKVKVLVPPGTPMSKAAPGTKADIKPGVAIYVATVAGKDGKLNAMRLQVGKDGINPTQ